MKILFTLGVYQEDRPERWASKHSIFASLSNSLTKLGHEITFYCNPKSIKQKFISAQDKYYFEGEASLPEVLVNNDIRCVVVWGGRTEADDRLRSECPAGTKFVYAEAGWFPQAGTCYFSEFGTNANARFIKEGLEPHQFNQTKFMRARRKVLISSIGLLGYIKSRDFFEQKQFDSTKPIFVPLQDEGDTNIVLSSPVKTMADFINALVAKYPHVSFVVRPHPRASYTDLPQHNTVTYQSSELSPYTNYVDYGGVVGINSTMLLQYALLGVPVAGVGLGIASGSGAYFDLAYDQLPEQLDDIKYDVNSSAKFFDYLLRNKQLNAKKLRHLSYVSKSYLPSIFNK
ncbi:hypothetical protein AB4876_16095 [Zhongshania guokunii]|uniref:Capsule polysaccharide biosynthesis protein n=1 Tax=Zhongshania guokunii TaxID=641783 RepID=A0ABV3U998_9GAMM